MLGTLTSHLTMTSKLMIVTYVFMSLQVGGAKGGHALHTSSYQIQQLWDAEVQTIQQVTGLLQSLDEIRDVLKRYLTSWAAIADANENHGRRSPVDPAAIYALLRHVAQGWKEVDDKLDKAKKDLFFQIDYLASRPDREPLPNNDDVTGASEALVKLAHVYRFNATALERGFIQETMMVEEEEEEVVSTSSSYLHSLSVNDLASIGLVAVNKGYFGVGVEFLRAARSRASTHHHPSAPDSQMFESHFSLQRLESLLNTAVKVHNHVLDVRGSRSLTHSTAETPYSRSGRRVQEKEKKRKDLIDEEKEVILGAQYLKRHDNKTWMLSHRVLVEQEQIERLCRGEDLRPLQEKSTLSCSYMKGVSPWLLLAPFKMEVVSLDPHIAIVYEVMTSKESAEVKAEARRDLATPHNGLIDRRENGTLTPEWSLKHVWLKRQSIMALQKLSRRLAHIVNVDLGDHTSEPFMVANYGLGGEYGAHRDTHGPSKRPPNATIGERMATVVTYLETPSAGGRLVFPWVGVGVDPVPGAAVVWWNLLASHEHDFLTRHAACPILRGHKWIANKWVGYNAQWNTQPCPIDSSKKIVLGLPLSVSDDL